MIYLLLGIGFVVIFSCMLILNNSIKKWMLILNNNIKELEQILINISVKETKIEEMLQSKDNVFESSNEDILKAIRNTYPHMMEDD